MLMTKMKSRAPFDKDELTIIKTLAQAIAAANKKDNRLV